MIWYDIIENDVKWCKMMENSMIYFYLIQYEIVQYDMI